MLVENSTSKPPFSMKNVIPPKTQYFPKKKTCTIVKGFLCLHCDYELPITSGVLYHEA